MVDFPDLKFEIKLPVFKDIPVFPDPTRLVIEELIGKHYASSPSILRIIVSLDHLNCKVRNYTSLPSCFSFHDGGSIININPGDYTCSQYALYILLHEYRHLWQKHYTPALYNQSRGIYGQVSSESEYEEIPAEIDADNYATNRTLDIIGGFHYLPKPTNYTEDMLMNRIIKRIR